MNSFTKKRDRHRLTNYSKRHRLLMSGRLILRIRKSNRRILVQVSKWTPTGDRILWTAKTNDSKTPLMGKNCKTAESFGKHCGQVIPYTGLILCTGQKRGLPGFIASFLKGLNSCVRQQDQRIILNGLPIQSH